MAFLQEVADGAYVLEAFTEQDMSTAIRLVKQYADLKLGLADASLVVLAARYRCRSILTLDERHFRAIRLLDGQPVRLLPADE